MNACVFLDRDGTLMENAHYCGDPAKVAVFPGAAAALGRLRQRKFRLVMITNQSGIGRGYFTKKEFHAVQAEFTRQLGDGLIDAVYFCPDAPEHATPRRKPGPGMVLEAASDLQLDLHRSFLIGDHASDIECARRAGLAGAALVLTGHGAAQAENCHPDFLADDLGAAVDWILEQSQSSL